MSLWGDFHNYEFNSWALSPLWVVLRLMFVFLVVKMAMGKLKTNSVSEKLKLIVKEDRRKSKVFIAREFKIP